MTKNATKFVKMTGELQYPRFFESIRDMGNPEAGIDYADTDGVYKARFIVTKDEMERAVREGIPAKQGAFEMFKEQEDGRYAYNLKRPHLHKHFMQFDDDGNPTKERLVVGPPFVFNLKAFGDAYRDGQPAKPEDFTWDSETAIGNGSTATVKLRVREGRSAKGKSFHEVWIDSVGIIEHVEYEQDSSEEWV